MGGRVEHLAEGVTLYNADCRDVLPTLGKVDAVVTDPPYGIGLNTNNSRFSGGEAASVARRGNGPGTAGGEPIANDDRPIDLAPILAVGSEHVVWGWNCYASVLPRGACLVWIKRNDAAFGTFLSDAEVAWFSRGHGVYCFRDLSNTADARHRVHPTQKPLPLMQWCLQRLRPVSRIILDPFMGSGTTGVAAVKLGRKFIGIEIEPKYFDIACRRIAEALKQPDMFVTSPAPAKQEAMAL